MEEYVPLALVFNVQERIHTIEFCSKKFSLSYCLTLRYIANSVGVSLESGSLARLGVKRALLNQSFDSMSCLGANITFGVHAILCI